MEKRWWIMKKIVLIILFCSIILGLYFVYQSLLPKPQTFTPALPLLTPSPQPFSTIEHNKETYAYSLITVDNPQQVTLIPNFTERLDSESIIHEHTCQKAVNGGFYDKTNNPLGLFISEGNMLRGAVANALINGYIAADDKQISLSLTKPDEEPRFALQTGPFLIKDGNPLSLAIRNDENARRMAAATSSKGTTYFIAVFNPNAFFEGPLLSDLPIILKEIVAKEHLIIDNAVNLDGGSASAFVSATTRLSELTPVGSLFCVK
jgi:uncharacterized protein YigE (DUF2233 family)